MVGELARIIKELLNESDVEDPEGGLQGLPWDVILELREEWLEEGIRPLSEQAMSDDIAFLEFEYEVGLLTNLNAQLLLLGAPVGEGFFAEFVDLVGPPMESAMERALARCKTEHRLGELAYAAELEARLQLIGYPTRAVDFDSIVAGCARFRLVFESTITQEGTAEGVENRSTSFVVGEIDPLYPLEAATHILSSGPDLSLVGAGPLEYRVAEGTSTAELPGGTCEATYVSGVDSEMMAVLITVPVRPRKFGPWSVPEIHGKVSPPPDPPVLNEVRVALDPGDPIETITGSCPGFEGTGAESATWDTLFAIRHVMESVQRDQWASLFSATANPEAVIPEQTGFLLGLDQFTGGRIYSTGIWESCDGQTATGGVFGQTCERTFITLYHEPEE